MNRVALAAKVAVMGGIALLCGCSSFSLLPETPEVTLAELPAATLPDEGGALPQVPLTQVAENYRQVLAVTQDPQTRLTISHRLADIALLDGEASLASNDLQQDYFTDAIEAYETLLRENPDNPRNDELMYQLSKAYEFSGENARSLAVLEQLASSHPESAHLLETEFRKAESYFSAGDYSAAEVDYTRVVDYGAASPYYTNALYMQGWSRFKQGYYSQAIGPFIATLDQLVPADNRVEQLPRGDAELVQDSLRVLAVIFSYLDGAPGIAAASEQYGERPYQHLFYQQLGDLYLGQERYRDSAETYRAYTNRYPSSNVAHEMQLRVIESYAAGGFAELIVEEKQHYVELFSISGVYWEQSSEGIREAIRSRLQLYIEELARYNHALAQQASADKKNPALAADHYRAAGSYYQLFIDSFPDDTRAPDMGFLLAESRFEAGDYPQAITSYEWVAYSYSDHARAADAGYMAILAWEQVATPGSSDEQQRERIDSELRFATVFTDDSRAPLVLGHAATALLQLQDYELAISAADSLASWQPRPSDDIVLGALLVKAHSHFELAQYATAEDAFQQSLAHMPADDPRRSATTDHLAATVYRRAEEAVTGEDYLLAADQFARVMAVAPDSSIAINAHFDAASNYQRAGDLNEANRLLLEFRARHPEHELSVSIAPRLVANYEEMGLWQQAASELDVIAAADPGPDNQRQALYLAAQYYDKADAPELALARYRSYANSWPEPVTDRLEAMNRVAGLHLENGNLDKQQEWLAEIIAADAAQAEPTDRSRYLAAQSSSMLAQSQYEAYVAIRLTYPLKQSLRAKKDAMQRTLTAYQKTGDYGIAQFSTLASYRMAQVYQQLSIDLLNSQRPGDIDALALEQYELMLEEQAYPFEEKAIAIHEANARRSWDGVYDQWVKESFVALARILPARYGKTETGPGHDMEQDQGWLAQAFASDEAQLEAYNSYGIFLREQGRFADAEQAYLSALDVSASYPDTHRNIAVLYDLYLGEPEQALQHYHRYQKLTDADNREVAGWIADLERQLMLLVQGN